MSDGKHRFAIGALIGFVAGAVTALLMAPKSGKELRSDLKNNVSSLYNGAKDVVRTVRKQASAFAHNNH